jgi:hypothetical protein
MDRLPQPFWACLLSLQGVVLTIVVIFYPTRENIALASLAIASNLVSGALGAFAGHAQGVASVKPPPHVNPIPPVIPAEP